MATPSRSLASRSLSHNERHSLKEGAWEAQLDSIPQCHLAKPMLPVGHWSTAVSPCNSSNVFVSQWFLIRFECSTSTHGFCPVPEETSSWGWWAELGEIHQNLHAFCGGLLVILTSILGWGFGCGRFGMKHTRIPWGRRGQRERNGKMWVGFSFDGIEVEWFGDPDLNDLGPNPVLR